MILLLCYFVENPRLRIYPQIIPKNLEESFEGEVVIHVQQITLFKKTFAKKKCSFLQVLENPLKKSHILQKFNFPIISIFAPIFFCNDFGKNNIFSVKIEKK